MTWNDEEDSNDMDLGFDVADVEPAKFDLIPDGVYDVVVGKVRIEPTKDQTGKRLNVELTITTEGFSGRKLFDGINIRNKSEKAEAIGRAQAASLFKSAGVGGSDASALVGQYARVKIKTQPEQNGYDAKNVVKAYLFEASSPAPAPSTKAAPSTPAPATDGPPKRKPPAFAAR